MKGEKVGKRMTLHEVANATGAGYSTVADYASRLGWTQNGKKTLLDETQITAILEAMKTPASSGRKSNLLFETEGIEPQQSLEFQIAMAERRAKELWHEKALRQEQRAVDAERKLLALNQLLESRTSGLEHIQRIAESVGTILTDRDDLLSAYRRGA